jgi:hypothetical protein
MSPETCVVGEEQRERGEGGADLSSVYWKLREFTLRLVTMGRKEKECQDTAVVLAFG